MGGVCVCVGEGHGCQPHYKRPRWIKDTMDPENTAVGRKEWEQKGTVLCRPTAEWPLVKEL